MGLGESKRVDLGKYLQALEVFAGREGVKEIKKEFGDYGITGTITVYTGSERGDGEVTIPFTYEGVKGFLRFNENGYIYEGLKTKEHVGYVSSDVAELFIGGLFGAKEIPTSSQSEYIKALFLDSPACWLEGSKEYCNTNDLTSAKESIDEAKKMKAEKAAKEAEEKRQQALEAGEQINIQKGNVLWKKADELIDLAEECDGGPGGIDPDDLRDIRNKYLARKIVPTNYEEAREYYETAEKMFVAMVNADSGEASLKEKGQTIGCSLSRTSTGMGMRRCSGNERESSGGYETISCDDIGTLEVGRWEARCLEPEPEKPMKEPSCGGKC